jgi:hypothetical protein
MSAPGSLAAPSSPCVSSANHDQLARTVGKARRAHGLRYTRDMTIKRLDHVSVVTEDLEAATGIHRRGGRETSSK